MNKRISSVLAIGIILILAIIVGVSIYLQNNQTFEAEKEQIKKTSQPTITIGVSSPAQPADIQKLLYACYNPDNKYSENYCLVDETGANQESLYLGFVGNSYSISLSPLRDKIVYNSIEEAEDDGMGGRVFSGAGLRLYDIKTKQSSLIATNYHHGFGFPKFSPDGKSFVYSMEKENENKINIYIFDLSTSESKKIVEYTYDFDRSPFLNWSPDGKYISFVYDGKLFITDTEGNTREVLDGGSHIVYSGAARVENKISTIEENYFKSNTEIIYRKTDGPNLFSVDINGENNKQLTFVEVPEDKHVYVWGFTISPEEFVVSYTWPKGQDPDKQKVVVYNTKNKNERVIFNEISPPENIKLSPEGTVITSSGSDGISSYSLTDGHKINHIISGGYRIVDWE